MIRCLAGDLNPKQPLVPYLVYKYDIWDEDVLESESLLENLGTLLPNDEIKLEDISCTYNVIYELNKEKLKKDLPPQLRAPQMERRELKQQAIEKPIGPPKPLRKEIAARRGGAGKKAMGDGDI